MAKFEGKKVKHGQRLSDMVEGLKAGYNAAMTKANCHI